MAYQRGPLPGSFARFRERAFQQAVVRAGRAVDGQPRHLGRQHPLHLARGQRQPLPLACPNPSHLSTAWTHFGFDCGIAWFGRGGPGLHMITDHMFGRHCLVRQRRPGAAHDHMPGRGCPLWAESPQSSRRFEIKHSKPTCAPQNNTSSSGARPPFPPCVRACVCVCVCVCARARVRVLVARDVCSSNGEYV
jgi:hypothetical protein